MQLRKGPNIIGPHGLIQPIADAVKLLTIIPIIIKKFNPRALEASTKYFLTQATTSILLIIAVIINLLYSGQ
eukprot:bmy_10396T0